MCRAWETPAQSPPGPSHLYQGYQHGQNQDGTQFWRKGEAEGSTKLFDQSLAPGKELSVFLLAAAAKGAIIRRWHFALKLFPSASDIFLFLLVRRPFIAIGSDDSGIRISSPLEKKPSPVTLGWTYALAEVKKADN